MSTSTMTVRVTDEMVAELERLAAATGRSIDELSEEAIRNLVDYEAWKAAKIERALEQAEDEEGVPHEEVFDRLRDRIRRSSPDAAECPTLQNDRRLDS